MPRYVEGRGENCDLRGHVPIAQESGPEAQVYDFRRPHRISKERLRTLATADPKTKFVVDLEARRVTTGADSIAVRLPDPARDALISGAWDATGLLLAQYDEVRRKAASLPYIAGF